jgi:hypothetical protein
MRILSIAIALLIASVSASTQAPAPAGTDRGYIARTFRSLIGEVPSLGWFIPGGKFVGSERRPGGLVLYAALGQPTSAVMLTTLTTVERNRIRREHDVACDIEPQVRLTRYRVGGSGVGERQALYTSKPLPGQARSGKVEIALTEEDISAVIRLLGWTVPRRVQRHEAVAAVPGSFFYSFHRRYDVVSGILREEALVLHDAARRIVAFELMTHREDNICDGCGLPSLSDGTSQSYLVKNVFEFAGFAYPVLLLDTSTVEGRALSLQTFTPAGRISFFRQYEYIVNCS